jgi:hypothetical protein
MSNKASLYTAICLCLGVIFATVTDSVAAQNGGAGFVSATFATNLDSPGYTNLDLFHVVVANNGTGFLVNGVDAFMSISQSMIPVNGNSWTVTPSPGLFTALYTYGDNYFGSSGNNTGSLTPATRQ